MASTGRTSGGLLDDVQKSTTATVSRLSCNVAVDTAEFMMNASLQIFPISQRCKPDNTAAYKAQAREARFMELMEMLTQSFVNGNDKDFDWTRRVIDGLLTETNQILAAEFTEIVQLWKTDKVQMLDQNKRQEQKTTVEAAHKPPIHQDLPAQMKARANTSSSSMQRRRTEDGVETSQKSTMDLEVTTSSGLAQRHTGGEKKTNISTSSLNYYRPCSTTKALRSVAKTFSDHPDETTGWGIDSSDGVLVGHPPDVPPGLLDWADADKGGKAGGEVPVRDVMTTAAAPLVAVAKKVSGQAVWLAGKGRNAKEELDIVFYEASDSCASEEDSDWVTV